MPDYTLTLTWKTANNADQYNAQGDLIHGAHFRRIQAIEVAKQNDVRDPNNHKFHPYSQFIIEQANGAQWQVSGTDANICAMIKEWKKHNFVDVTGGPKNCPP